MLNMRTSIYFVFTYVFYIYNYIFKGDISSSSLLLTSTNMRMKIQLFGVLHGETIHKTVRYFVLSLKCRWFKIILFFSTTITFLLKFICFSNYFLCRLKKNSLSIKTFLFLFFNRSVTSLASRENQTKPKTWNIVLRSDIIFSTWQHEIDIVIGQLQK